MCFQYLLANFFLQDIIVSSCQPGNFTKTDIYTNFSDSTLKSRAFFLVPPCGVLTPTLKILMKCLG